MLRRFAHSHRRRFTKNLGKGLTRMTKQRTMTCLPTYLPTAQSVVSPCFFVKPFLRKLFRRI